MSYKISEECSSCGACEPECPNAAISQGDTTYVINSDLCSECVGFFDAPQCASVCPVEAPIPDPAIRETEEQLVAKVKKIHPNKTFASPVPSHLKK